MLTDLEEIIGEVEDRLPPSFYEDSRWYPLEVYDLGLYIQDMMRAGYSFEEAYWDAAKTWRQQQCY